MSNSIVTVTGALSMTGMSNQAHVVYAANSGRWWAFYWTGGGGSAITASYSSDGITWTALGSNLTPANSGTGDGRDLSVFYANIASTDVVRAIWGQTAFNQFDGARGTISGTTLTWGTQYSPNNGNWSAEAEPHGGTTVLASDGTVFHPSPNVGDFYEQTNATKDTGSSWTAGTWGAETSVISTNVTNNAHSRVFVPYAAGGKILGLNGNDATAGNDTQIFASVWSGTAWGAETSIGSTSQSQNSNDWGVCRVSDTDFHVVRRTSTGFEHRRFNGTSWGAGSSFTSPPTSAAGTGIALRTDGTSVWLLIIDSGAGNNVKYSQWTSGGGWGTWTTLEATSATRTFIGCSPMVDTTANKNFLVYWSEGTTAKASLLATATATPAAWVPRLWPPRARIPMVSRAAPPQVAPYSLNTWDGYIFPLTVAPSGTTTNFSTTVEGVTVSDSLTLAASQADADPTLSASETPGLSASTGITEIALSTSDSQGGSGGLGPSDSLASSDSFTFAGGAATSDQATVTDSAGGAAAQAITEIALSTADSQGGSGGLGPSDSLAAAESLAEVGTDSLPADSVSASDSVVLASGGGAFNAVPEGVTGSESLAFAATSAITETASLNTVGGGTGTITFGADSLAASDSVALQSGGQAAFVATDTLSASEGFTLGAAEALADPTLVSNDTLGSSSAFSFAEVLAEAEAILFQWGAHLVPDSLSSSETLTGSGTWAPVEIVTPLDTAGGIATEVLAPDSVTVLESVVATLVIPSSLQNAVWLVQSGVGVGTAISSTVGHTQIVQSEAGSAMAFIAGPEST